MEWMEVATSLVKESGLLRYAFNRGLELLPVVKLFSETLSPEEGADQMEDLEGRGFSSSGGYTKGIKFPSIEVALLALAFLTFATQFIVNVQQLVSAIQNGRRRKRDLSNEILPSDWALEDEPYRYDNATEEIFRLTGLIENAEENLETLIDKISSCKASMSFFN